MIDAYVSVVDRVILPVVDKIFETEPAPAPGPP